jgi:hypothetical protein
VSPTGTESSSKEKKPESESTAVAATQETKKPFQEKLLQTKRDLLFVHRTNERVDRILARLEALDKNKHLSQRHLDVEGQQSKPDLLVHRTSARIDELMARMSDLDKGISLRRSQNRLDFRRD